MIVQDTATLVVLGTGSDGSATEVTDRLGLTATTSREPGEPPARGRTRPYAIWHLEVEIPPAPGDGSGTASLHALLQILLPRSDAIRALQADLRYDCRISWVAFSDSSQGGFVLDAVDAAALGAIGLPLYADVYGDIDRLGRLQAGRPGSGRAGTIRPERERPA